MPIKNIIFDWSGVLSDDFNTVYETVMGIFKEAGVKKMSKKDLRRELCLPYTKFYYKYMPHVSLKKLKVSFLRIFSRQKRPPLFPKTKETISILRAHGIRMVILSAHPKKVIERDLKSYGIYSAFSEINTDIMNKVDVINDVMKRNGFRSSETAYIGDMEHDIEAGHEANVITIASAYGHKERSVLERENPDYIIDSIDDLASIVLSKSARI
jgi:phosphoglycolate phosphatase